jgi:hypothetical protein
MAESNPTIHVLLGEESQQGQVAVALDSFLLFDNAVSHGLDALERRWADYATPASLRREIWENFER